MLVEWCVECPLLYDRPVIIRASQTVLISFLFKCFLFQAYAILCGQPMSFIAPTGLTLAFISGLYRFCSLNALPFFPVYSWVGFWTALFMILLGLGGSSQLIRFCTRFTDEVFNGLLSLNFIYEALASLRRNFQQADPMNLTMPFVALAMALTTFWSTMTVTKFETTSYFTQKIRSMVKDFGPVTIFVAMSLLNTLPSFKKFAVPTLSVPSAFQLAGGRDFIIPFNSIPLKVKLLCCLPAILLTSLFFMDQNISVRVVNNPDNKLKKGPAYNMDMVALGLITGGKKSILYVHAAAPYYGSSLKFPFFVYSAFNIRIAVDVWSNCPIDEPCSSNDGIKIQSRNGTSRNCKGDRDSLHGICHSCNDCRNVGTTPTPADGPHTSGFWSLLILGTQANERKLLSAEST